MCGEFVLIVNLTHYSLIKDVIEIVVPTLSLASFLSTWKCRSLNLFLAVLQAVCTFLQQNTPAHTRSPPLPPKKNSDWHCREASV